MKFITSLRQNLSIKSLVILSTLGIIAFSIPGQNYYQESEPKAKVPEVKGISINVPDIAPYPLFIGNEKPDFLSAKSIIVVDVPSNVILYEKNPDEKLLPASTTKITTAVVALDHYRLGEVLTVKKVEPNGSTMGLVTSEQMTFENLLYGLLVRSGNDAAVTIAENYPGGIEQFIYAMNQKAESLNMKNTHYANVDGLDQENHYTTVRDLATMASYAMKNLTFSKIVNTQSYTVPDLTGKKLHTFKNVNDLLGKVPGVNGIKTGWTEQAGDCLVASVDRNGRKIITVILGSNDRFGETEYLIEWAYHNHKWQDQIIPNAD